MKKLFFILVFLASPAWADDMQTQLTKQQQQITALTHRLELVQNALIQEHNERTQSVSNITQSPALPKETPSQAWNRIHTESQQQKMEQDIESNRNEIFRMEHGY